VLNDFQPARPNDFLSSFQVFCGYQNLHFEDRAEEEALRAVVEGADQRVDSLIRQASA
jgi:hypothetical protein